MTVGIRVSVTQPSAPALWNTQHRVAAWSFSIFYMNSPVIFAGALTIFAGALPRGPHPGEDRMMQASVVVDTLRAFDGRTHTQIDKTTDVFAIVKGILHSYNRNLKFELDRYIYV